MYFMEAKSNNVKLKKAWLLWAAMPFLLSAFRCGEEKVEPERYMSQRLI